MIRETYLLRETVRNMHADTRGGKRASNVASISFVLPPGTNERARDSVPKTLIRKGG